MGEKRLGKNFQYDMPSDLVMTYLSEVSIYVHVSVVKIIGSLIIM